MFEKIKIAYLDYSHIYAGAERVLSTIISNLDQSMYEPILIFPYPMNHQKEYDSLNCEKIYLSGNKKWWMGSKRWKHPLRGMDFLMRSIFGYKLANILRCEKITMLHVNLLRPDSLMWILPAKRLGIKIIGHFRSQSLEWVPPGIVQKNCDLILCVSQYSQKRLLTKGEYTRTHVLYDSINVNLFTSSLTSQKAKKHLGVPEDCFLLASIGQLSRHKGHDNAIRAFAGIASSRPKAYLYIAGGGRDEDLAYLEQIAAEYPSVQRRIIFSGRQLSNIVDLYCAADLILSLTKVGEAFGLVPYEAALMQKPFIAPNKGAVKEFIKNGENGILVDTNDVQSIASKMEWVISHPHECEIMNIRARRTIMENLTPDIMIHNLNTVYQELSNS